MSRQKYIRGYQGGGSPQQDPPETPAWLRRILGRSRSSAIAEPDTISTQDRPTMSEIFEQYPEAAEYGPIFNPFMSERFRSRLPPAYREGLSGSEAYSGHGMAKGLGGIEEAREQMAEMRRLREEDPISGPGFDGYLTVSDLREPYPIHQMPVTGWGPLDGQRLRRNPRYPGSPLRRSADRRALDDARRQMYDIRRLREKDLTQGLTGRASGGLMSLQEGGPAPGQTQVTSFGVPQQTEQQWSDLTDDIVREGQREYQPYHGQRIAGVDPATRTRQLAQEQWAMGTGPAGVQQAATNLQQGANLIQQGAHGVQGLQGQQQDVATQLGAGATAAQQQAQAGAQGMQNLAARAELQGQLAGAGMRQTGAAAQTEQQALGAGQAAAGQAGQALMTGLGQQMGQAGQQALGGPQD